MDYDHVRLPRNPRDKANPVSRIFFFWTLPLFRRGYSNQLHLHDLYSVAQGDSAHLLGTKLTQAWEKQLESSKKTGKPPKFYKALVRVFWPTFLKILIVYCLDSWVIQVGGPVSLKFLIQSLNEGEKDSWETFAYAFGVVGSVVLHAIVLHPTVFLLVHLGMQCRVATSSLIYKKALKLRRGAEGDAAVGRLVNLLSNDVNRFDYSINFIPFLIAGPIQFLIFVYFLWDAIGISVLAAVGFILILLPFQFFSGKYAAKYRSKIAKQTDVRGGLMNEIVGGIRVIKMYAWEKPFSALVHDVRKLEVTELRKRFVLRGIHLGLIQMGPKLVAYVTFLVYVLAGNKMTSETVFFTMTSLFVVVQIVLHFMPEAFAGIGETIVAINRIQDCLMLQEHVKSNTNETEKIIPSIKFNNATASWSGDRKTLDGICGEMKGDKLVMVVGAVGAGKSSLLQLIISELLTDEGSLDVKGRVSYASQEPWIFPGTLQQNILFGLKFNASRYKETLRVCALEDDLRQFPDGDMTLVGERGVSLSGGQKARVNLARAVYRQADIYLLDDPLSAVDPKVSRHLVDECLKGRLLEGSLKVLVTHQVHFLQHADHVLLLGDGKVLIQGTYEDIMASGFDLMGLVASPENEESTAPEEAKRRASNHEQLIKSDIKSKEGHSKQKEETAIEGEVTRKTYWEYFKTGDSLLRFWFLVAVLIFSQLVLTGNDYWLSFWAKAEDSAGDDYWGEWRYLVVYTAFNITACVFCFLRALLFYSFCMRVSVRLHNRMFSSLVRAPTAFFDANPSGRIMNRFTKDMGAVDELLPPAMADAITIFMNMGGAIVIVIMSNYFLAIPAIALLISLFFIRRFFIRTARDLKRIEALTRSPLFTHLAATMQGLTTIRSSNREEILIEQFNGQLDKHSSVWFLFLGANRWFGIALEMMCSLFVTVVTFSFLTITSSNAGGNAGLAISSVISLMGSFQWGMRQSAEAENFMTSVERALEYANLTSEAELESKQDKTPPSDWPKSGFVSFRHVSLSYNEEKPVLSNLTFDIEGKSKVGIVGRTGAGKSSMIAALFRLTEPSGEIFIDGIKVNDIGLHDLRTKISIIPQDPILFSGTVRYNLDPFSQFNDADLWKVIEEVELKTQITNLEDAVVEGGSNFSVGQRQLICLARAILRKNKILVMDEATANVDPKTDALIQSTIRRVFTDCTTITIAHRLHSVIDSDRILVLDKGRLKECDHPHLLLQNNAGLFSAMVKGTGKASEVFLRTSAQKAFSSKSSHEEK